ncbi:hypothetical protein HDU76_001051 [Blyttiomyces sp. JEL0837]|nr:hypothetical protein HDU76_001051 [Blyttiomyces sp. JEL0837]
MNKGNVKLISLGVGHALQFMDQLLIKKRSFDVIDTSNLADDVGMFNLMVNGSALLKQPQQSILTTCSCWLHEFAASREDYLDKVVGLPAHAYSTVLGLELKTTNDDHWVSQIAQFAPGNCRTMMTVDNSYEFFYWRECPPSIRPVSIKGSPFLMDALKKCLLKTSVPFNLKYDEPGGVNTTAGAFSKMLALAFAQQRITYDEGCQVNVYPFREPVGVVKLAYSYREMKATMTDVHAFMNMYGFVIKSPEVGDTVPLLVKGIFDMPHFKDCYTPGVVIEVRAYGAEFTIESLHIVDLPNEKNDVYVRVLAKSHANNLPLSWPYGKQLKLSEMKVVSCPSGAVGHIIQGAMQIRQSDVINAAKNSEDEPLEVGFVHQVSELEFQEDSIDGSFTDLGVSKKVMKIPLPSPVKLVSCKIHRKSGFLLLTFKKHFRPFPLPILSTKNLPQLSPNDTTKLSSSLAVMFTD